MDLWYNIGMREIKLTQGQIALVDDEDYERINQFNWFVNEWRPGQYYAVRCLNDRSHKTISMHRDVMGLVFGDIREVDHIHHNTLDNRQSELRVCTHQENCQNQLPKQYLGIKRQF